MTADILILRPGPAARKTADLVRSMGFEAVIAPIFHIRPMAWEPPPPEMFDAVFVTSANAMHHAGPGLALYTHLPCYAVGESSAKAAADAGFSNMHIGKTNGQSLIALAAKNGVRRMFHPCGKDHMPLARAGTTIERQSVYSADAVATMPDAALAAIKAGAIVLLHSPRAAAHFAALASAAGLDRDRIPIAAISEAVATAAGTGWKIVAISPRPRDQNLVEIASRLGKDSTKG